MPRRFGTITDRFVHDRSLRRWQEARAVAGTMTSRARAALAGQARALRTALTAFEVAAGTAEASRRENASAPPLHSDWSWRPDLWAGPVEPSGWVAPGTSIELCKGVRQYHDCILGEFSLRQTGACMRAARDDMPFGLEFDVFGFSGSFLSVAFELPETATKGLRSRHLIGIGFALQTERAVETFARLNLRQGPNTRQLVREIPPQDQSGARTLVEFDFAYTANPESPVNHMWLDLIFEAPAMNRIALHDVLFSRRPRAEL